MKFAVGDRILVPTSRLEDRNSYPTAFLATTVCHIRRQSVRVDLSGGGASDWIGSGLCHKDFGLLILSIGDLDSELALIDPLAKSVLQFARLLVSDDYVRSLKIRSLAELSHYWNLNHSIYSHVVLIGHGNGNSMKFAVDSWVAASDMAEVFEVDRVTPKTFINLSCKSGFSAFGKEFSDWRFCRDFIGPFHSVHGAIASQFVQTWLAYHVVEGETVKVAHTHARASVPGTTSFRLWRSGRLIAGPS